MNSGPFWERKIFRRSKGITIGLEWNSISAKSPVLLTSFVYLSACFHMRNAHNQTIYHTISEQSGLGVQSSEWHTFFSHDSFMLGVCFFSFLFSHFLCFAFTKFSKPRFSASILFVWTVISCFTPLKIQQNHTDFVAKKFRK